MATLYISEFATIASVGTKEPQVVPMPSLVDQTVAIGGTSAKSAAFSAATRIIRVEADVVCSIVVAPPSPGPTATATNMRLAANAAEYFGVPPGYEIAVITNS